jgi:pyruvate dehydrogenase E1 component beta subunit
VKLKKYKILTTAEAINEALVIASKKFKKTIFLAEGLQDPSFFFNTTNNLKDSVPNNRLIEIPLSELAITGICIGASMQDYRPILSFQRVEFAILALEQIINNAAKAHYVSYGKHKVPIVIRLVIGRGWGQGPAHSQSLENLFASIPGLKVVMPTFPEDTKGLLLSSIKDNNPVIFLEHRWCHYIKGKVKKGYFEIPLDQGAKQITRGNDYTVVATSYGVLEAMDASKILKKYNIHISIFDLRVLRPLKLNKILGSVKKTKRLMIVDTGHKTMGMGAEISSQIHEKLFKVLKGSIKRLGLPDHPMPSSRGYVKNIYPNSYKICDLICQDLKIKKILKKRILEEILKSRKFEIDVPNPDFRGPF